MVISSTDPVGPNGRNGNMSTNTETVDNFWSYVHECDDMQEEPMGYDEWLVCGMPTGPIGGY